MAGIMLEIADENFDIEIIPGVTACNAAAAAVGAPIMHDSVNISLSDLLTDWDLIKKRIDLSSQADFVISLYNPKSNGRTSQIQEAQEIMLKYKKRETPVAIVKNAKREGQEVVLTTLSEMLNHDIDMLTMVIIGNSMTFIKNGKMVTPRGYKV